MVQIGALKGKGRGAVQAGTLERKEREEVKMRIVEGKKKSSIGKDTAGDGEEK